MEGNNSNQPLEMHVFWLQFDNGASMLVYSIDENGIIEYRAFPKGARMRKDISEFPFLPPDLIENMIECLSLKE